MTLTQMDEQENLMSDQQSIHWLVVDNVSDAARTEVTRLGGQVMPLATEPAVTLVGIAHAGKQDLVKTTFPLHCLRRSAAQAPLAYEGLVAENYYAM